MTVRLSRKVLFLIGVTVLFIYLFISRINFLIGSMLVEGHALGGRSHSVEYIVDRHKYIIHTEANTTFINGQPVTVICKKSDPGRARVYSMLDFWIPPFIWGVVPLMLYSAAIFSFMGPDDSVEMKYGKGGKSVNKTFLPKKF